ncbi:MAG: type II toxin-antitoxin system MqsA family antitoxin [Lachnospiraceae bacterium]|nr:type II toxin-antitoxin system MqsA family antitoxin [Lachnospiraceae bacterium]
MCMYCKCKEERPSTTVHVVNYHDSVIIVKNVPCQECVQCGEKYFSMKTAERLEEIVNAAKKIMQEISVIDYEKAA